MKRNVDLKEISDGNLYGLNDMVKAGCCDCKGCSDCCHGMGNSIVLDPFDIYRLVTNLGITFEQLLSDKIELNVVDGIILPNLKMKEKEDACGFLNSEGRCSIHQFRPGICRLFPLGRYYESGNIQYFLQVHECTNKKRVKVKVRQWIDTPDIKKYEQFVKDWHYFILELTEKLAESNIECLMKTCSMYILNQFFIKPYSYDADFYTQFKCRLLEAKAWKETIG
ncbi:MAG: YkgJ family cysteine cluster protein [Lachnospiraceae bacterium]|nr:YkgJ family cysteine cluster protein [Lachnospiraceae bacterium]